MNDQQYLTAEGAAQIKQELEKLKGPEREAKEDQGFLEGRIQELEYTLQNAIIVENGANGYEKVEVGARVTIQEEDYPPETYSLVGAKEADPRNGKISNESPIGSALMGACEGDEVIATTPAGQIRLKILKIE